MGGIDHDSTDFGILSSRVVERGDQDLPLRQKVGQLRLFNVEDGMARNLPKGIRAWVHLRKKFNITA